MLILVSEIYFSFRHFYYYLIILVYFYLALLMNVLFW